MDTLRRLIAVGSTLGVAAVLLACPNPVPPPPAPMVEYDIREGSTAVTNLAVVSPENLYVWNRPSFADDKNLVYSAKQWVEGRLPVPVSVWRSPSAGGPATKLIPAGENELLLNGRATPRSAHVYMSVNCSVFSNTKAGIGGRKKYASSGYCDFDATPFPDESRIMFASCARGTDCYEEDTNYIWLVNPDGTNMIQLRQGRHAVLSPDGKSIAFSYGGDIWTMKLDGSEATNISASEAYNDEYPAYAPDGKRIFFARQRKTDSGQWDTSDIWVMNLDGTEQIQLTMNPADDTAPYAAPDGYVYFMSNRGALVNRQRPNRIWRMQVLGAAK
jgi:Tol biopolymer transport system component